jgi:hypothetical protein
MRLSNALHRVVQLNIPQKVGNYRVSEEQAGTLNTFSSKDRGSDLKAHLG